MTFASGARVGPYEILSALGAGGRGEVYRARDPRLGREVAIKVLPAAYSADPDRLSRFEKEARAAAALNHPHILAVHDIGTHGDSPYIVSELLDGKTLREQLEDGPLPVRRAIEYAIQTGRWIAYRSNESGRNEIYVRSFPKPSAKYQISKDGGNSPRWRADGRELLFDTADGQITAVPLAGETALEVGTAVSLFRARLPPSTRGFRQQYDVTRDGQRFLVNAITEDVPSSMIMVVLDGRARKMSVPMAQNRTGERRIQ